MVWRFREEGRHASVWPSHPAPGRVSHTDACANAHFSAVRHSPKLGVWEQAAEGLGRVQLLRVKGLTDTRPALQSVGSQRV